MDTIHFEVRQWDDSSEEVAILINGRILAEILGEVELPFATQEGSRFIAGSYIGLPLEDVKPPSQHFLGRPKWDIYNYGDKVSVLECGGCQVPGCWPFLVKITLADNRVIWSDFGQPHRSDRSSGRPWKYDALEPFVFNRQQYMAALEELGHMETR